MKYPTINMKETGNRIKKACMERGITAKEIKEYMNLTSAQSVYGWFHGKACRPWIIFMHCPGCWELPWRN